MYPDFECLVFLILFCPSSKIFYFYGFQVLLRQEHYDQGPRQEVRLQVRLPRPYAGMPDTKPRSGSSGCQRLQISWGIWSFFIARLSAVPQTKRATVPICRAHSGISGTPAITIRCTPFRVLEPQLGHDNEQPFKPVRHRAQCSVGTPSTAYDVGAASEAPEQRRRHFLGRVKPGQLHLNGLITPNLDIVFHFCVELDFSIELEPGQIFRSFAGLSQLSGSRFWLRYGSPFWLHHIETPPTPSTRAIPLLVPSWKSILNCPFLYL